MTFTGQVGNYVLTTHLDPNDEARGIKTTERLIDRILDERVRPSPLADGNLLEAEFLLRAMIHWVCDELGIPGDDLELPYRGAVTLTRTADGFRVSLQMQ